ncbi:MAG: transposase [Acidobacteriaceae bacterium]
MSLLACAVPTIYAMAPAEEWVSAKDLLARTGLSDEWLRQQRVAGSVVTRESGQVSANGRPILEYLSSSLPATVRAKLGAEQPLSMVLAETPLPLFANVPAPEQPRILLPDPEDQKQAEERYAILESVLQFPHDRALRLQARGLRLPNGQPVSSKSQLIHFLSQSHGISARTLKRWEGLYRAGGFAALADRRRSDRHTSRWAAQSKLHTELAELAVYAYLEEKLSKAMAWEIAASRAKQLQIEPPTYETIRALLENVPAPIKTFALEGRRKYEEVFCPYIRRGYTDFGAGEILVSDHAIHDVIVQNDLFDAMDRAHMRLRFTGLLDMRSRKFTGYAWSQEGSSRSIVTCLRRSLTRFGPSRLLYVDNGKDYQKVGKGAGSGAWNVEEIPPEALGVIARLGMEIQYCIKFHPQSKLIERANNTLHQRFDRRFVTYTGPTPEQRPDRCIAALERHQKLLSDGRPEESDLPLASEFIKACIAWIEGEYHNRPHQGEGMNGLTPLEAFDKFRWTSPQPAPEPAVLAMLLAERATRMIRECAIEISGRRYIAADAASGSEMHAHTGQSVMVAFDPCDMEFLAALDEDGRVFAYLQPEKLLRQSNDVETRAAIAASMKERGTYRRDTREQLEGLSRRVLSSGYVPQHEQMLQVGRLPIAIDDMVVHRPQTKKQVALEMQPATPPTPAEAKRIFMEGLKK